MAVGDTVVEAGIADVAGIVLRGLRGRERSRDDDRSEDRQRECPPHFGATVPLPSSG